MKWNKAIKAFLLIPSSHIQQLHEKFPKEIQIEHPNEKNREENAPFPPFNPSMPIAQQLCDNEDFQLYPFDLFGNPKSKMCLKCFISTIQKQRPLCLLYKELMVEIVDTFIFTL